MLPENTLDILQSTKACLKHVGPCCNLSDLYLSPRLRCPRPQTYPCPLSLTASTLSVSLAGTGQALCILYGWASLAAEGRPTRVSVSACKPSGLELGLPQRCSPPKSRPNNYSGGRLKVETKPSCHFSADLAPPATQCRPEGTRRVLCSLYGSLSLTGWRVLVCQLVSTVAQPF